MIHKHLHVLMQAMAGLLLSLLLMLLFRFLGHHNHEWQIALIIFSVFIILNPFLIKPTDSFWLYIKASALFTIALGVDLIILTALLTKTQCYDLPGKSLLFVFPLCFYPLSILFAYLFRWIHTKHNHPANFPDNV